ncbi:hypothetical protein DL546_003582 [Coniochaeta pulveracea]|uniref:MARVEL domain-containing protein n=1 Tax=Coniochaeta pulveracea TaxID=177199 RepID=A0A420Y6H2_9PEZI|nr:hypothetical protein DL546_003582 [Coniochaeta pulveracea]
MTFKDHGYYGYAYFGARVAQGLALLPILGLVGNCLSLIARSKQDAPAELVATMVFVALSTLWVILSLTAYDDTHIPYLATTLVDTLFLIPFIVVAAIIGQPLSETTCSDLPKQSSNIALPISTGGGRPVSYVIFTGSGQTVCYELMAAWGFLIALCVLFAISAIAAGFLFIGKRKSESAAIMQSGNGFPGGGGYPMNESQIEMAPSKGSTFSSAAPSIAPHGSRPGTAMGHNTAYAAGGFNGPPVRGFPGGLDMPPRPPSPSDDASGQPSFDQGQHALSPPPQSRR